LENQAACRWLIEPTCKRLREDARRLCSRVHAALQRISRALHIRSWHIAEELIGAASPDPAALVLALASARIRRSLTGGPLVTRTDIRASLRAALGALSYLLGLLTAYYAGKISAKLSIVLVQKLGQATMSLVGGP
jgi:hypothetical protein